MTIPTPAVKVEGNFSYALWDNHQHSLLYEVDQTVEKFLSGPWNAGNNNALSAVHALIEKLVSIRDQDLSLAREGLCHLLRLNIEEVQKEVIHHLKPLLHLLYLPFDIENNQLLQLIKLEKQVSEIIGSHSPLVSFKLLLSLIDLYTDIIERLWLLPYLIEDRRNDNAIEENMPRIIDYTSQWVDALLKDLKENIEDMKNRELIYTLKSLLEILQMVSSCPPDLSKKIADSRASLMSFTDLGPVQRTCILTSVGEICHEAGILRRAISHYRENVTLLDKIDYNSLPEIDQIKAMRIKGLIYKHLGKGYFSLSLYRDARSSYKKALVITQLFKDKAGEEQVSKCLGDSYSYLGKNDKAIKCYEDALKINTEYTHDREMREHLYSHLGCAYDAWGKHGKAIEHLNRGLKIAKDIKDQLGKGDIYGNLGIAYGQLGEYERAVEYHKKHLKIAQKLSNPKGQETAYCNLGNANVRLGRQHNKDEYYEEAITYYKKSLSIAKALKDMAAIARAYQGFGNIYFARNEYEKVIKYGLKRAIIARDLDDLPGVASAYATSGHAYRLNGEKAEAIECHTVCLKIVKALGMREKEAFALNNLGYSYESDPDPDLKQAEEYFFKSIMIYSELQTELKENYQWKITLFEEQAQAYTELEKVLLKQGKENEALELTESRRSRALVSALSKKFDLHKSILPVSLTSQEMQAIANKLNTTFVIYSFVSLLEEEITAWVVSSKGITRRTLSSRALQEEIKDPSQVFNAFPYANVRPIKGKPLQVGFKERLPRWYETLIAPIEKDLPKDPQQTVTIVPDGYLSHLPFAAFQDGDGKYLIEKHPLSLAPSLHILQLLDQCPRDFPENSLVIGNPTTPILADNEVLKSTEQEAREIVAPLLKNSIILTKEKATATHILKKMPHARYIHLSCHGELEEKPDENPDPHSVFQGFFKLVADEKHPDGHLHSQEIIHNEFLHADLVLMSACYLGRGKLQKEGSIGLIWSFLGIGALSTIASYWPLPAGDVTIQMVETFYRHLLGKDAEKLNKAQSLQRAALMVMEKDRDDIRQWGAFFLSGLS